MLNSWLTEVTTNTTSTFAASTWEGIFRSPGERLTTAVRLGRTRSLSRCVIAAALPDVSDEPMREGGFVAGGALQGHPVAAGRPGGGGVQLDVVPQPARRAG